MGSVEKEREWAMWNCAYGIRAMVKSNNLYAVYAACLMLHNSRQPRTHTHTHADIYTESTLPTPSGVARQPLLAAQFAWVIILFGCLAGCYS